MRLGPVVVGSVVRPSAARQVDRHPDAEMGARILAVHDLHRAAMRSHELQDDGEADTGALDGGAPGGPPGVERLENVVPIVFGDAGTVVGDIDDERARGRGGFDVNGASLRGVFDGIRHQIFEYEANFAPVGDQGHILHLHIESYALGEEGELLVFQHLLDDGPQTELARLQAHARSLPGAEGQEILDHPLQLDAVVAQDGSHLALCRVELAHRPVHEELGALPDIGERGLELMRHMTEEAVALLRDLHQPQAQPFELLAEALQVVRPADGNRITDAAVADLADRAVDLPQRPPDDEGQSDDLDQGHRQESRRLPEEPGAGAIGLALQREDFSVDLRIALLRDLVDKGAERRELPRELRCIRHRGACRRRQHRYANVVLDVGKVRKRLTRCRRGVYVEFCAGCGKRLVFLLVRLQELGIVQDVVKTRCALQGRDLTEQLLARARGGDALDDDLLAGCRQGADLKSGGDDRDQERQGEQPQPE